MEILPKIHTKRLALLIRKNLLISDLHIGFEESLNKQGLMLPRNTDILARLKELMKTEHQRVIINGDLKHEFGTISDQEWREVMRIFRVLETEVILIKGNHDKIIGPLAEKSGIKVVDHVKIQDIYITHGHEIPENIDFVKSKTVIIGHEHPAVGLHRGARKEVYKCFLVGKYKNKNLVVMPSFNNLTMGNDVLRNPLLSPFLDDISDFTVYVPGEKTYNFGTVGELVEMRL